MSFRFQKRVKIAPGVRLNISKRGVSTSVGRRGASLTVGKRGIYGNAGIPGTGLSYRTRLDQSKKMHRSPTKGEASTSHDTTSQDQVSVEWDDTLQDFLFKAGSRPLTPNELATIRKTHRKSLQMMYEEKVAEINAQTDELLTLHQRLFNQHISLHERAESSIEHDELPPNKQSIQAEIIKEYKDKLSIFARLKLLLPHIKRKFQEKIDTITKERYEEMLKRYNDLKAEVDSQRTYRLKLAQDVTNGNVAAMEEWIALFLDELDFPLETNIDYHITSSEEVYVDVDLPTLDEVPIKKARLLKTGRIKIEDKTQRDHREDYATLVGGTAFYLASFFFSYLPTIKNIVISGYNQVLDKSTGHEVDQYIYSLKITEDTLSKLKIERTNPIKAFEHFNPRMNVTKTYIFKEISPYEPRK